MLLLRWSMGAPVCVVELLGPFRSLGRSRELTKGYCWKILGLLLLSLIPGLILGVVMVVTSGVFFIFGPSIGPAAAKMLSLIGNAMWTAFFAVLIVVAYHDLRVAKEGIGTDQIAAVFE
jgi:branched-subunit amino acid transport protein AzlD